MHDLIKKNLAKLVTSGAQGLFPFPVQPCEYAWAPMRFATSTAFKAISGRAMDVEIG